MPNSNLIRAAALALVVSACGGGSPTAPLGRGTTTYLSVASDAGDYIGQGETHRYEFADGAWQAYVDLGIAEPKQVRIMLTPSAAGPWPWWWQLDFSAPEGQSLRVGTYENARRFPFSGTQPGLSVYGTGRGCNTLTGRFIVSAIELGPANTLDRFRATFEQHCEGGSAALRGEINIVANPWR